MSKTIGGLFALEAKGQIGHALIYSGWKGLTRLKRYRKPRNPQTTDQQANRTFLNEAVAAWQTLEDYEKELWNAEVV